MKFSSRPEDPAVPMTLEDLSETELELIASLLYNTKLGHNVTPWRDAAFTLLQKIERFCGEDFVEESSNVVEPQIIVLDVSGTPYNVYDHHHFEIEV